MSFLEALATHRYATVQDAERAIYRFLKTHATKSTPLGPLTIGEMTSIPVNTVKVTTRRMLEKNLLQQTTGSSGYYVESSDGEAPAESAPPAADDDTF